MMNVAHGQVSVVRTCWPIQTRAIAPTTPPAKIAASSRRSSRGTGHPGPAQSRTVFVRIGSRLAVADDE